MSNAPEIEYRQPEPDRAVLLLRGDWRVDTALPDVMAEVRGQWARRRPASLRVDTSALAGWDTLLVSVLFRLEQAAGDQGVELDLSQAPDGVRRLLHLAAAVPEREGARKRQQAVSLFQRVGERTLAIWREARATLHFVGQLTQSLGRLARGDAQFRRVDLVLAVQQTGAEALPIVTLISVLVGMILAYVGALQLRQFGAQIYIADLVGLGITREMGAMMTAVIMAGRSGAAFASQIGAMQVNEEVDALTTLGFSPIDFLVLPRMLALFFMMPLLCLYADFMGMLGGALVCAMTLDISFFEYFVETQGIVGLNDVFAGVVKAVVFGGLVALAGCFHGVQCGRNASAVGQATTAAVVMAIVMIVVADAVLTIFYDAIGL